VRGRRLIVWRHQAFACECPNRGIPLRDDPATVLFMFGGRRAGLMEFAPFEGARGALYFDSVTAGITVGHSPNIWKCASVMIFGSILT